MNLKLDSLLLTALLVTSCDLFSIAEKEEPVIPDTLTAYFADAKTKTYLMNDTGDLAWSAGDDISLFFNNGSGGGAQFTTELGGETAEFSGEDPASGTSGTYYAVYPYDASASVTSGKISTTIPTTQVAEAGTFANDMLVTVGKSTSKNIGFYHICGGIRFSVSKSGLTSVVFKSNAGEKIAGPVTVSFGSDGKPSTSVSSQGSDSITLNCPNGFETGKFYYICIAPTVLTKGFSMTFTGSSSVSVSHNTYIEIGRAVFGSINNANDQASINKIKSGKLIATDGTANCYIVSAAGDYKFPAVKGNTSTYLGQMSSVELFWETDNSATAVSKNSIIKSVDNSSSYIYFSTPETLKSGNALIAAKDASGNVIWSWHIWVVPGYNPKSSGTSYMDRNLGALSESLSNRSVNGFFYQWGRKDPFGGYAGTSVGSALMAFTGAQFGVEASSSTINFSVAHPNIFIKSGSDWLASDSRNNNLWSSTKTEYDPCPPGWRVPTDTQNAALAINQLIQNKGAYLTVTGGTIWLPCSGYMSPQSAERTMLANVGYFWSATAETLTSVSVLLDAYDMMRLTTHNGHVNRATGLPVRCVKE